MRLLSYAVFFGFLATFMFFLGVLWEKSNRLVTTEPATRAADLMRRIASNQAENNALRDKLRLREIELGETAAALDRLRRGEVERDAGALIAPQSLEVEGNP